MKPLDSTRRALLDAANRERTPDAETRQRVLASLLAAGGATAVGGAKAAHAAGASAAKAGAGLAHWLLLAALGTAGIAGVFVWFSNHQEPPARPAVQRAVSASALPSVLASTPSRLTAVDSSAPARTPIKAPFVASAANATNASAIPNALERELSLLQSAHAAYRSGQAGKALQLAQEHARSFPHSQLAAERQTIEVLSLCALGRVREARSVADKLRAASGSPSLAGLDDSCAGK